jgi:hypothetical protein
LTKDGNRAADSVIASNLSWNWNTVSVDAYEFYVNDFSTYLDDVLGLQIAKVVTDDNAQGFFTNAKIDANDFVYDFSPLATAVPALPIVPAGSTIRNVAADTGAWIDGYRVKDNNFNGYIFGGKAAVSKDKAKQLDQTVEDSIRKLYDPVGTGSYDTITINGVTYNTLSWLKKQVKNGWTVIGVNDTTPKGKAKFTANEVIAVRRNEYGYLYQPYAISLDSSTWDPSGYIAQQTFTISMAEFTNQNTLIPYENEYTGYEMTGLIDLTLTVGYDSLGNTMWYNGTFA